MGPTHLGQGLLTLGFRPVELLELGHGKTFLELDGIAPNALSGIYVPLCWLAGTVAVSSE
jgi:hypothetical protein